MDDYLCGQCNEPVKEALILVNPNRMYTTNPLVIHLKSGDAIAEQLDPQSCLFQYAFKLLMTDGKATPFDVMQLSEFERLVNQHAKIAKPESK
ncbi:hypothetical protein HYW99_02560 [Candidatus Woesearchaeota archaeon]|nr:hypothetical protein [Candidatus Woesearchaeota archaeon]